MTTSARQATIIDAEFDAAAPAGTQLREIGVRVGELASLGTTDKTSIVAAINEVRGLSTAATKADVRTALTDASNDADNFGAKLVACGTFDPSTNAGERTVGTHAFGPTLPDKAIVVRSWYKVVTTFESATSDAATVGLGFATDGATGVKAAVAISNGANAWDAGLHDGLQDNAAANMIALTAARQMLATIAVEDVTAGKLRLYVEYVVGQ